MQLQAGWLSETGGGFYRVTSTERRKPRRGGTVLHKSQAIPYGSELWILNYKCTMGRWRNIYLVSPGNLSLNTILFQWNFNDDISLTEGGNLTVGTIKASRLEQAVGTSRSSVRRLMCGPRGRYCSYDKREDGSDKRCWSDKIKSRNIYFFFSEFWCLPFSVVRPY